MRVVTFELMKFLSFDGQKPILAVQDDDNQAPCLCKIYTSQT